MNEDSRIEHGVYVCAECIFLLEVGLVDGASAAENTIGKGSTRLKWHLLLINETLIGSCWEVADGHSFHGSLLAGHLACSALGMSESTELFVL